MIKNTTNVTVRMDKELKEQAESLFDKLGLNMTTALNIFLKQTVRTGGLPFDVTLNVPNIETIKAIEDVRNGRNLSNTFETVDEMMGSLTNF